MFKKTINIILVSFLIFFINTSFAFAAFGPLKDYSKLRSQSDKAATESGFEIGGFVAGEGIGAIISTIIKAFLSLLGLIFVILVIYGGYNWMTAGGDEAKVEKAKKIIQRAIIGLIITVAAYAITEFVFSGVESAMQ